MCFDSIPVMAITWRLIDPNGTEVTKATTSNSWDPHRTKYADKQNSTPAGPHGGYTMVNFGGRDPRLAQNEELREKAPDTIFELAGVPAGVLKTPAGYRALPISARLDISGAP